VTQRIKRLCVQRSVSVEPQTTVANGVSVGGAAMSMGGKEVLLDGGESVEALPFDLA
jgi:hypothetical protein